MIDKFTIGRRAPAGRRRGTAAFGAAHGAAHGAEAAGDRLHLRRAARRLRLQPGACRGAPPILKKMPGVKVVEEEKVPETVAVEKSMESMINLDGATLMFPTSFGYFDPHMLKMAAQVSRTSSSAIAAACGPRASIRRTPAATSATSTRRSISPASSPAATSKSGKLGFVAAKPIPQVLRNINAFTLGAQSVNPKITTQVIFTGDWSMPVKEAEATNRMIAQGVDVVTCHVDSPKVVVETAERAGIFTLRLSLQPGEAGAQGLPDRRRVELGTVYVDMVDAMKTGQAPGNFVRGGLKEGFVRTSAYGPAVAAAAQGEGRRGEDGDAERQLRRSSRARSKDNKGNTVIPAGTSYVADRARAREHELPRRRRDRRDVVRHPRGAAGSVEPSLAGRALVTPTLRAATLPALGRS